MQEPFPLEQELPFMRFMKFWLLGKFSKIGFAGSKLKSLGTTLSSFMFE